MFFRRYFLFVLLFCGVSFVYAQTPKSSNYEKENDFMVAVLNNPTFSLFDFISIAGLHETNTKFLDESAYMKNNFIKKCKELYGNDSDYALHAIYMKVKAAWKIFLEVQNTDVSYQGMGKYFHNHSKFDTRAPRSCPYPELKHKLSIIPLRLEEY